MGRLAPICMDGAAGLRAAACCSPAAVHGERDVWLVHYKAPWVHPLQHAKPFIPTLLPHGLALSISDIGL